MLDVIRLPNQGDGQAFDALSTRAMKVFNFDVVNDPDVKYYSWGAKFEPSYFNTFKCVALLLSSSVSFDASSPLGER
jgi:triacylglycerol lipase